MAAAQPVTTTTNPTPPTTTTTTSTSTRRPTSRPSDNTNNTTTATSTTSTTSSKRTSLPPRPPLSIHPTVIIGPHVQITGRFRVRIDAHSIIHPYAKIHAQAGEVRIGKGCIVAERVVLGGKGDVNGGENGQRSGGGARGDARRNDNGTDGNDNNGNGNGNDDGDEDKTRTALGSNVVLESGAVVEEGCRIGDMSVVDVEGKVGAGSVIGRYCKITSALALPPRSTLPDYTILYGTGSIASAEDDDGNDDCNENNNSSNNSSSSSSFCSTCAQRIDTTTRDRPDVIPALKIKAHSQTLEMQRRLVENHVSKWL